MKNHHEHPGLPATLTPSSGIRVSIEEDKHGDHVVVLTDLNAPAAYSRTQVGRVVEDNDRRSHRHSARDRGSMSVRRPYTCGAPGPYKTHCTDTPGHRYSCYDASHDASFNERQHWPAPHQCDDDQCPDNGYQAKEH